MNRRAWWATWGCKRVGQNLVTKQTKQNNKKECEKNVYTHTYMFMCVCVYMYMYIYIYI